MFVQVLDLWGVDREVLPQLAVSERVHSGLAHMTYSHVEPETRVDLRVL